MTDLFEWIDRTNIHIGPIGFNAIKYEDDIRRKMLILFAISLAAWAFFGWDSTWNMIQPIEQMLYHDPENLLQSLLDPNSALRAEMQSYYGVGDHWSALVIYGLAYYYLSKHLQSVGVVKSLNFFATTCLSLMNVGLFEIAWNNLYGRLHGQMWVCTIMWGTKQFSNLAMFYTFITVGILMLVMLWQRGYRVTFPKWKQALVVGAFALWLFWIFYPLPFTQITVEWWTSGKLFPQTFYAVNTGTMDNQILTPHWVQNDLLHGVNTLVKVVTTAAYASLFMLVKPDESTVHG